MRRSSRRSVSIWTSEGRRVMSVSREPQSALRGTGVATPAGMKITDRHRWLLVAGLSSLVAGEIATTVSSTSWRLAAGNDPPEDPTDRDFDWTQALLFGAIAGAVV